MRCVFAKGKLNQRPLSAPASKGSFILPVENASLYYAPGDLIFLSDAGGANVEFPGPVTSVSSMEIQCLSAVSRRRAGGSLCWNPLHELLWPQKRSSPIRRTRDTGVEIRRSSGGVIYLTKIREASCSEILRFESLRLMEMVDFTFFLQDALLDGIEPFTFCDESSVVYTAALVSSRILENEASPNATGIEMEIARIKEGRYQE